jgi:hypothetical protein
MTHQADFIDSSSPYEGEICTTDPWPLPKVKPWAPKPSLLERIGFWLGRFFT